jgi:hypothetical protein
MKSSICSDIHTDLPFYLPTLNKVILAPAACGLHCLLQKYFHVVEYFTEDLVFLIFITIVFKNKTSRVLLHEI